MSRLARIVFAAVLLSSFLAAPSQAQDQTLILRFGVSLVEPTSETGRGIDRFSLGTRGGIGAAFEWMFQPNLGLEVSHDLIGDVDVERDGDYVAATTLSTLVVGVNFHPIRNARYDWGVGAFYGGAFLSDWEGRDGEFDFESRSDSTWGAQTFVDISVSRRWAVDLGLKYYDASVDFGRRGKIDYNPLLFRVMGVVRW